ncbi:hypothetical protein J4411_03095 [Candidatus Pacearchaeota archaeon]|nr:hypothetical protein [Candidatus Pacearchaeota archaeon]
MEEKEIKKILGKISTKKQKKLILERANKLSKKEKERIIELFDIHNRLETTAWLIFIAGLILWAILGNILYGIIAFAIRLIFWFIVSSKKQDLVNELKKIE